MGKPHRTMRLLITLLTVFTFGQLWSQTPDDYVRTIETLRGKGKLTAKRSEDKTFVGAVTGYYHNDSIVLINTLTDAEAAGTETLYFVKDGVLKKVFIMAATFESNADWKGYYSKHKSVSNCYTCHGEANCIVTEITLGDKPTVIVIENKKKKELDDDEKDKMFADVKRTSDELQVLIKQLE
jgi:hypothetical protein